MAWKKYKPKGYYRTCPLCGASLDPGEICDCGVSEYVFSGEEVVPERLPKREARAIIPPVKLPECRIERPDVGGSLTLQREVKDEGNQNSGIKG